MRNHPLHKSLEALRDELGNRCYYQALAQFGLVDELIVAESRHEEPGELVIRVQTFLDMYQS